MSVFSSPHPGFSRTENGRLSKQAVALGLLMLLTGCADKARESDRRGDVFPLSVLNKDRNLQQQDIDLSNKKLLINFWATWCLPCREEMPFLQELSDSLDPKEYAIIGVSIDDDSNLVKEFLLEYNIQYPNFLDENGEIASEKLDIKVLPETLLISSSGIILNRIIGKLTPQSTGLKEFIGSSDALSSYSRKADLPKRLL